MPQFDTVKLDQLHFDPDNPRLPHRLKGKEDQDVLKYFLLEGNLIELMLSIGEKDFFPGEPLLVVPREGGGLTVVEGNRRLGAMKLLQDATRIPVLPNQVTMARQTAKFRPVDIPVLRFGERAEILSYLGYRHITGIKEWDALAKARYLEQLRGNYGTNDAEAHRALAREIGSKAPNVAKLLTGLKLLERARDTGILDEIKIQEDEIPFSLLTTGIGWENIAAFIGLKSASDVEAADLKQDELREFFFWVFDKSKQSHTVLGESRNFSKLARVVANATALAALRRGDSLSSADLLTSGPLEVVRTHMFSAEGSIKAAQETSASATGLGADDVSHAERIRRAAVSLHSSLKGLVEAESEEEQQDADA